MSSVPSLYAYVFIGRVSSETRYLTDNGDLTIFTDSVESPWISTLTTHAPDHDRHRQGDHQRVSRASAHCKLTLTRCLFHLSHTLAASHPRPPEPSPFSCRRSAARVPRHQCRIPLCCGPAPPLGAACRLKTVHSHHPLLHV